MTVIALHGARNGDRAIGKPRVASAGSERDPVVAVPLARRLMLSGAWQVVPKTGDDVDKAAYLLRSRLPAALAVLGRAATAALTRPVPLGGCSWCVARFFAAASLGVDPEPEDNEHTRAYLGARCARCRQRDRVAFIAEREREHVEDLVAAGFRAVAAGRLRTPEQVEKYKRNLRALEHATLPPRAPTGAIWATGARRVPDPPYYRRRRDWPASGV